jgi:hypothetical protein
MAKKQLKQTLILVATIGLTALLLINCGGEHINKFATLKTTDNFTITNAREASDLITISEVRANTYMQTTIASEDIFPYAFNDQSNLTISNLYAEISNCLARTYLGKKKKINVHFQIKEAATYYNRFAHTIDTTKQEIHYLNTAIVFEKKMPDTIPYKEFYSKYELNENNIDFVIYQYSDNTKIYTAPSIIFSKNISVK